MTSRSLALWLGIAALLAPDLARADACADLPTVRHPELGAVPTLRLGLGLSSALLVEVRVDAGGGARLEFTTRRTGAITVVIPVGTPVDFVAGDEIVTMPSAFDAAPRVDLSQYGSGTTWQIPVVLDAAAAERLRSLTLEELRVEVAGLPIAAKLAAPQAARLQAMLACAAAR